MNAIEIGQVGPRHWDPMARWSSRLPVSLAVADTATRLRRRARGGLIVDLDDTLYYRDHYVMSGFAVVAQCVARIYCVDRAEAFATLAGAYAAGQRGHEFQTLCRAMRLPASLIGELVELFREHKPSIWLSPGVEATLDAMRRDGWRIAILTNGMPSVQAAKVAALNLAPLVDHVLYAESLAIGGKPSITTFQAALVRLGLPADMCLCVGDSADCDIDGALRAGIRAVHLVPNGAAAHPRADAVIEAFEDLPAVAASLIEQVTSDVA